MPRPKGSKNKKINGKIRVDTLVCTMCGKSQKPTMHYQSYNPLHATGYLPYCKECLKKNSVDHKGIINIEKFKQTLKIVDRPFLYDIFKSSMNDKANTIGTYFKNLAMPQYRHLGWIDSIFEPICDGENVFEMNGDISNDIIDFFGIGYSPDEYKMMHQKYSFLKNNYPEKTNMHVEALKTYVRYKVKEELATAKGDVGSAKSWGELANKAATNAKINPSQLSAADLSDGLSTFGQLVRAVEQSVDVIPILPTFKQKPQDIVDFTIWCYINYIRDLKGLPQCSYEDIYKFYDDRKNEYKNRFDFLKDDTSEKQRENVKNFIKSEIEDDIKISVEDLEDG